MKKVILLALLMPYIASGQVIENFESGEISNWVQSNEGRWDADTTNCISGNFSLHHTFDNPDAGTDCIGIPVHDLHPEGGLTSWTFLIRYGCDPSSSNNWSVFLLSDSDPKEMSAGGTTNGYAAGVNLSGLDDTLRLWKVKDKTATVLVNSHVNWQTFPGTENSARLLVERSVEGIWHLAVYTVTGQLISEGTGTDGELFNSDWFGICYRYTSSRDRLLWFDDLKIEGSFYSDTAAPRLTTCRAVKNNSVEITFDESPDEKCIVAEIFSMNSGDNTAASIQKISNLVYRVEFSRNMINKEINRLLVSKICDRQGNCDSLVIITFVPVWADPGDIVITEIMADPLPEVSLPDREYLEISNRTNYPFNLKNWRLQADEQSYPFPEITIQPMEALIVCLSKDISLFSGYGKVAGLKQFPILTDAGRIVSLNDSTGSFIHGVEYSSNWYGNELKSEGGWSLEMVDIDYPFAGEYNWIASESRNGGTPGTVNSVSRNNPDNYFHGMINVFPDDSLSVSVNFSETVLSLPEMISNVRIDGKLVTGIKPADQLYRKYLITPASPLRRNKVTSIEMPAGLSDFAGNTIQKHRWTFGMPVVSGNHDILFNELLFNPWPSDPDYIEFYNCSSNILDGSSLRIVTVNDQTGDTSQTYPLSAQKTCIMPGSYYTITPDRLKVYERYFSADPEYIYETGSMPSMSDDKGHLLLYNRELDKIDEVWYNEKMHNPLIDGVEGIALEKVIKQNRSDDPSIWHSASQISGWGTPGAPNSIMTEFPSTDDKVVFSSTKISPDSDGYEDLLVISFTLRGKGNVVSVWVFNENGTFIKRVAENLFIGPEASIVWDGTANDGSPVSTGIYIILITLFDDKGKSETWKKVCTVIRSG